ncbi:poly(A) binding protein nuclear 1 isoform X2 [Arctopsyche grandis]|uniref:poly(A) binding protein nuclear 1 isoform X2 n=1 Tax=Arctopsyche grandis TaxID=121162 RepID=UPI00406D72C4
MAEFLTKMPTDMLTEDEHLEEETNGNMNTSENTFSEDINKSTVSDGGEDAELAAIKARVREMEEEREKIKQLHTEVDKQMSLGSPPDNIAGPLNLSYEEKVEVDTRSIYVGNVDYGATAEELEDHFRGCGYINRVTILCNKYDGHPKGFAYIEFGDKDGVQIAMALDDSLFRGRQIKVLPKRTNTPGMMTTNRFPRVARGRGRGLSRGAIYGYGLRRRARNSTF